MKKVKYKIIKKFQISEEVFGGYNHTFEVGDDVLVWISYFKEGCDEKIEDTIDFDEITYQLQIDNILWRISELELQCIITIAEFREDRIDKILN